MDGEGVIGIVVLLLGLVIAPLGIYFHATKRRSDKAVFPYVLTWVLGAIFIVGGAMMIYTGTNG